MTISPRCVSLIFGLGALTVCCAATGPETPASAPAIAPEDFGPELNRLAALGIPDLPGGKWVQVHGVIPAKMLRSLGDYFFLDAGGVMAPVADKVWIKVGEGAGPSLIMIPGVPRLIALEFDPVLDFPLIRPAEIRNSYSGEEEAREALRAYALKIQGRVAPVTPPGFARVPAAGIEPSVSDREADITGLIDRLKKIPTRSLGDAYSNELSIVHPKGALLIFAAQLYRAGETGPANRLARALLTAFPDRTSVMNAAITAIADMRRREITIDAVQSGDWAAYGKALTTLLAQIPEGWTHRAATEKLRDLARNRITNSVPEIQLQPGATADPETLAALEALGATTKLPPDYDSFSRTTDPLLWTVEPPKDFEAGSRFANGGTPPIMAVPAVRRLEKSGMAAIPTLVAALRGETLTPFVFHDYRDCSLSPQTRGDLAFRCLVEVIPSTPNPEREPPSREELARLASAFWNAHHNDTPAELAAAYLDSPGWAQKRSALQFFIASDSPADAEIFERHMLQSPDLEIRSDDVDEYLQAKRGKAASFGRTLVEKFRETLDVPGRPKNGGRKVGDDGVTRVTRAGVLEIIARIERLTRAGKPPREALADIVGKIDPGEINSGLNDCVPGIEALPLNERIPLLVEVLTQTENNKPVRDWCLQHLRKNFPATPRPGSENPGESPEEQFTVPAPGSPEALKWLSLVNNTHPAFSYTGENLGEASAYRLEELAGKIPPEVGHYTQFGINSRDAGLTGLFVARAKARLEGRVIPPWPNPAGVSVERLHAILASLLNAGPDDIAGIWTGLELAERMAFSKRLEESRPGYRNTPGDPLFAEAFKTQKNRLTGVFRFPAYEELSEKDFAFSQKTMADLGLAPGDTLGAKKIVALCETLIRRADEYSGTTLQFSRNPTGLGYGFYAYRIKISHRASDPLAWFRSVGMYDRTLEETRLNNFTFPNIRPIKGASAYVSLVGMYRMHGGFFSGPTPTFTWNLKAGKVIPPDDLALELSDEPDGDMLSTQVITARDWEILSTPEPRAK